MNLRMDFIEINSFSQEKNARTGLMEYQKNFVGIENKRKQAEMRVWTPFLLQFCK